MIPITNLLIIASQEKLNHDENLRFRAYLKGWDDPNEIDEMVWKLNNKISAQIDCTKCGNCCKTFMIEVETHECKKVSNALQMAEEEFKKKYLEISDGGKMLISTIPCHFLSENKCTIYENRFEPCSDFPNLDKPHFISRTFSMLMSYGICPIVYNVMEELKLETKFDTNLIK
jgi:uncharacterized protein